MKEMKFKAYLLGLLSEDEQAHLEIELLASEELYEQLLLEEEALSEAYLQGALTPQERLQFERVFLAHPERQENLQLLQALQAELGGKPTPPTRKERPDWWERWQQNFGGWKWATAGLLLLMACFGATLLAPLLPWASNSVPPSSPVASLPTMSITPRPSPPVTAPSSGTKTVSVELSSIQRMAGGDEIAVIQVTAEDKQVKFRLGLEQPRHESYKVTLESYDPLVREELPGEFKRHIEQGVSLLEVFVPTTHLQTDEYALRVEGLTANGTRERAGLFKFKAERK